MAGRPRATRPQAGPSRRRSGASTLGPGRSRRTRLPSPHSTSSWSRYECSVLRLDSTWSSRPPSAPARALQGSPESTLLWYSFLNIWKLAADKCWDSGAPHQPWHCLPVRQGTSASAHVLAQCLPMGAVVSRCMLRMQGARLQEGRARRKDAGARERGGAGRDVPRRAREALLQVRAVLVLRPIHDPDQATPPP